MESRKAQRKYEDMEPGVDHRGFELKKTAAKIADKTQRALQAPLTKLVHQTKDERLIDDDYNGLNRSMNIVDNGGFNDGFTNLNQSDEALQKVRSSSEVVPPESRKPVQTGVVRKNTGNTPSNDPQHIPNSYRSSPNEEFIDRKRTPQYTYPFQTYTENIPDGGYFNTRKMKNDSLVHCDNRKMPKKGDVLSFHKIMYAVSTKKYLWSKPTTKTILDGVSGIMLPGVNAIMGPTGCGKSSLLDVLAGRKDPQFMGGKVLINGLPQPKNFKCMTGYVVQDDIVMGTLTVKENLMFSAALRLPSKYSKEDRVEKVDKIIEELGLSAVAHSKIGTELIRGVSGGERKRCNIGMELITDPVVLFLDEPTTGLDAFTAAAVIKTLQRLSRKGKTIILSIHQPKYSIYKLFDRYTLMAKGKIVYHGRAGSAPINYFQNLGYFIEPHNNPSDFYIDIIHGEVKNEKELIDTQICPPGIEAISGSHPPNPVVQDHALDRYYESGLDSSGEFVDSRHLGRRKSEVATDKKQIISKLVKDWQDSQNNKELNRHLEHYNIIPEDSLNTECKGKQQSIQYATNWCNQLKWVSWRTAINLLRNPQTSTIQLGVYLFFALSMGVVYFGLTTQFARGYQDRYGLFFFAALQVMFVNLGAIEIFIKERPIFIHENSSGYYRVSSYFFAKLICDMVPVKVFPAVVFLPITYFMSKLKADTGAFFFFELILLLTTSAGCSIAFFVSSSFSVFGLANVVTPIIYVFMMVFSGYLISIDSIFVWLNWARYVSAFRYALAGLMVNEINGTQYCQNVTNACVSSSDFLNQNAIPYQTGWDLWVNPVGLLLITLVFLTLCYIQLRRINKYK